MFYVKTALGCQNRNGEFAGYTTTNGAFTNEKDAENEALGGGRNGNSIVFVASDSGKCKIMVTTRVGLKFVKKLRVCKAEEMEQYNFPEPVFMR